MIGDSHQKQEHKIIWIGEVNPAAVVQCPSWLRKGRTSSEYIFRENIAEIAAREKVTRAAEKQEGGYVQYHESARKESGGRRVDRKLTGFVRKTDMKMMGFNDDDIDELATGEPTEASHATSAVTATTATTVHSKKATNLKTGEKKKAGFSNDQLGADSDDDGVLEKRASFRSEHRKQTGNVDKGMLKTMFQDDGGDPELPPVAGAVAKPGKAAFKPVPPSEPRDASPRRPNPRFAEPQQDDNEEDQDRANLNVNFDANCRNEEDQDVEPEDEREQVRVKRIRERRGTGKVDKAAAAAFTGGAGEESEDNDNDGPKKIGFAGVGDYDDVEDRPYEAPATTTGRKIRGRKNTGFINKDSAKKLGNNFQNEAGGSDDEELEFNSRQNRGSVTKEHRASICGEDLDLPSVRKSREKTSSGRINPAILAKLGGDNTTTSSPVASADGGMRYISSDVLTHIHEFNYQFNSDQIQ